MQKPLKLYGVFAGLFATVLVLVPPASSKIVSFGPLHLPGGTVVFPLVFIFNDVLTEVYGYEGSRRIIWTGVGCQLLAGLTYGLIGALPAAPFWPHQREYEVVLGFAPRVALASMTAYFCGEFANSFVLSRMKYRDGGRRGVRQGWRFLASTIVGEAVDSALFMVFAYGGKIPAPDLVRTLATLYVVKVVYEAAALPLSTRLAEWVKRVEGVDRIDAPGSTDYNPFAIFFRAPSRRERSGRIHGGD
ncbi:MAG TPA: queuosine precursor transporter [Planctomycetota bacterium]|nr:queuosine precursor transporter [Planctomycetota bacterium]